MTSLEKARKIFAEDRFAVEATGIEIDAVADRYAKCSLTLTEKHKNAMGHIMGGVMFTLADFVFAVASNFNGPPYTVTTVSQISYFNSPKGNILYGESHLLKDGKSTCFYRVDITDNEGVTVATVTITGTHINR